MSIPQKAFFNAKCGKYPLPAASGGIAGIALHADFLLLDLAQRIFECLMKPRTSAFGGTGGASRKAFMTAPPAQAPSQAW